MKTAQAIRIGLLLVVIFAAGILTGRFTTDNTPVSIRTINGRLVTAEAPLDRLVTELNLDPAQKELMRPVVEEMVLKMRDLPATSVERKESLLEAAPRMRAVLRPDQEALFEQYLDDVRKRFARATRRQRESEPR